MAALSNYLAKRGPLIVAAMVFLASSVLALVLHHLGAFADYDRLFEADPNLRIGTLASGWRTGVPDSIHALFPYVFSVPIRLIALPISYLDLGYTAVEAREFLALLVAPLCNAFSTGAISYIAYGLGIHGWRHVMLIGIVVLAFSNGIFGSIPDHMAPTQAVSVACLLVLFLQCATGDNRRFRGVWWTVAVLAPGITITNATFVATNKFVALLAAGMTLRKAISRAVLLATGGTIVAVTLGVTFTTMNFGTPDANPAFMNKWLMLPSIGRVLQVVSAIGESFVSFALVDRPGKYPAIVHLSSLQPHWPSALWGVTTLALAVWGGLRLARLGGSAFWLAVAASLHLAGILLFLVWGDIPFLYSQHWIAGHALLLCGLVVRTARKDDAIATAAASGLLTACALATPAAWVFVLRAIT